MHLIVFKCFRVHSKWSKFCAQCSSKIVTTNRLAYVLSMKSNENRLFGNSTHECDVIVRNFPHLPVYRDSCFDCLFMSCTIFTLLLERHSHTQLISNLSFSHSLIRWLCMCWLQHPLFGSNIISSFQYIFYILMALDTLSRITFLASCFIKLNGKAIKSICN